jgi:hypothetical protein
MPFLRLSPVCLIRRLLPLPVLVGAEDGVEGEVAVVGGEDGVEGEVAVEAVAAVEGEDLANFSLYASAPSPSLGAEV